MQKRNLQRPKSYSSIQRATSMNIAIHNIVYQESKSGERRYKSFTSRTYMSVISKEEEEYSQARSYSNELRRGLKAWSVCQFGHNPRKRPWTCKSWNRKNASIHITCEKMIRVDMREHQFKWLLIL